MSVDKDTPEQSRLRKAVGVARRLLSLDMPCPTAAANELLAAAEAVLPKRELYADFSACGATRSGALVEQGTNGDTVAVIYASRHANAAQAIRAACLLKHSKRLMEARGEVETDKVRDDINAAAERLIGEAGVCG